MSLSCSCDFDDWEPEPGEWYYWSNNDKHLDFEKYKELRGKRCCSCGDMVSYGDTCIKHLRHRYPHNDVEAAILNCDPDLNEEPPIRMADHVHCEKCGEIYLNLVTLGYNCLSPSENMKNALSEYHEMTDFEPIKKAG